ncbi:MAG: hypothetical protein ACKOHK_08040, partial [Planctomycetia bacterium]
MALNDEHQPAITGERAAGRILEHDVERTGRLGIPRAVLLGRRARRHAAFPGLQPDPLAGLDADTGRLEWSQPFAEVDERWAIDNRDNHGRRLAGLSPALAEGVLVCPTGAGAVVAIDLATRTLLWAHEYPRSRDAGLPWGA